MPARGGEAGRCVSVLWRDPRRAWLLMVAYFLLSLAVGPAIDVRIGTGALSGAIGWVLSAFFTWRVTRGGRCSRMLLIFATGAGFIAAVIMMAITFSPAELGALAASGAQIALLLSPAVYARTRPAGQEGAGAVALWRRRKPARLVAALAAGAVLGLAGAAASAAVISDKVHGYDADSVRLLAGHPVPLTLSPGAYSAFGGCIDKWGCAQLSARDLSIRGTLSGPARTTPYGGFDTANSGFEQRTVDGQQFVRELAFTVPVREPVRIAFNGNPRQPVLIAPSQDRTAVIRGGIVAAAGCALLLLGSLAGLAWPLPSRARPRAA
ncbi:MAG: hypothetical protein JWM19_6518 [Actinomycetia bacterium]|nr:hypothetical protein [Actinomycetes bacterium]